MNSQDIERVRKEKTYYLKASIFHFLLWFLHLFLLSYVVHLCFQAEKWWLYPLAVFEIFWMVFHAIAVIVPLRNFCYLRDKD